MTDWFPIVFFTLKMIVIGTGMFFAIKWHYDQGKKGKVVERGVLLRTTAKVLAGFLLALLVVGGVTFFVCRMMGLELSF
ncbi:hypothetical protein [Herbaspirillum sp. NPDC087042]|uniref:hypothetical protein n=1 Tax=Herbaspirillum sp. NPDC087042 TaxID=3364004 RepID=UPI0037F9FD2D